ncbi:MAG: sigma-70 family RNA polymerase sigma factor [Anaerolineales bacterium]
MTNTDWQLIQACRNGDQQAWEELINRYKRLVFSIPLNFGLNEDDAADVLQRTFIVLMERLDTLREDGNLTGWLGTIARRHTWRIANRHQREPIDPEDTALALPDMTASERQEQWERLQWLHHGMTHLDERCQKLLQALYLEHTEPSYEDIATRLGLAVGSIGPTRARCLQRLKEFLKLLG